MPLTYTIAKPVQPAITALTVQNLGINIRLPLVGESTVTFYFAALDGAGKKVDERPLSVTIATLKTKYPTDFATVYGILKKVAYQEAQDSGLYPLGAVV